MIEVKEVVTNAIRRIKRIKNIKHKASFSNSGRVKKNCSGLQRPPDPQLCFTGRTSRLLFENLNLVRKKKANAISV